MSLEYLGPFYTMIVFWICMLVVSGWLEIQKHKLYFVWIFFGSVTALIITAVGMVPKWQFLIFASIFIGGCIFTAIIASRMQKKSSSMNETDKFIGQITKVIPGNVIYMNGQKYQYITDKPVMPGERVIVISRVGRKMNVRKLNNK